jgi:hypothetical protein
LTLTIRQVSDPGLASCIEQADLIAVAAATSISRAPWSAVQAQIAARDVPICMVRLLPSRLFNPSALSGSCVMHRDRGGEAEVACWAQQEAVSGLLKQLHRSDAAPPVSQGPGNGSTRFIYQGR